MIQTNNMYYCAFLLNEGLIIANVELQHDSRFGKTVSFSFRANDPDVERKLSGDYSQGTAETNIRRYLDNLTTVRDIIYRVTNNGKNITEGTKNEPGRHRQTKINH